MERGGVNPMFNFDWQIPQTPPASRRCGAPLSLIEDKRRGGI